MTLEGAPGLHLAFASLHLLVGHFGSAAVHWIRFRRSPLVLYRRGASPHQRITRLVSLASLAWAAALSALAPVIVVPIAVLLGREKFSWPRTIGVIGVCAGICALVLGRA